MGAKQHSTRNRAGMLGLAAAMVTACLGCGGGEERAQLLVVVDTDAPLAGQLPGRPELSADAAVDTLRIDAIDASGRVYDVREFVAPSPLDWPISLGVARGDALPAGGRVRLRLRAFRGELASREVGGGVLEPLIETAIDRVVDVELPTEGVVAKRVVLSLACVGRPASFLEPITTCVDEGRLAADPSVGVAEGEHNEETVVGSAAMAQAVGCNGAAPEGALCIPGGYSVLGDVDLAGIADLFVDEPLPLRPVWLSPFWMDVTEVTVGRFRQLVQMGAISEALPAPFDPSDINQQYCGWRGPDDDSADARPLNCVGIATAVQVCSLLGGQLPSEAQWEHAARGRGQRRSYPWGDDEPSCCSLSAARGPGGCFGTGPEPVASHGSVANCAVADVSRDGLLDLAGSLVEMVSDVATPFGEGCWDYDGYAVDPRCEQGAGAGARGGKYDGSFVQALSALRKRAIPGEGQGFRCAYPDAGGGG